MVGLGGYAGEMADLLAQHLGAGVDVAEGARFVAACDPQLRDSERANRLRAQGVRIVDGLDEILAMPEVDVVWLPLPIQLHRPFTEKALRADKAVICEKPAAGCIQDVDAMVRARDAARLPVAIGFQDIYDPAILQLKRRISEGAIGAVTSARMMACWPRDERYFGRSDWAGRMGVGGTWVLDSPANNALAHPINVALFLLGATEKAWAEPVAIEAELYRANAIENYDTCSLRVTATPDGRGAAGVPLLILMTHACRRLIHPVIEVVGTRGRARVPLFGDITLFGEGAGAPAEQIPRSTDVRMDMLRSLGRWFRGQTPETAVASLETARPHALLISGASAACRPRDIPSGFVVREVWADGVHGRCVPGIEEAFEACVANNQMIHESGKLAWSEPARSLSLIGFKRFDGPPGN
jgi:predicted dehydrogenase